MKKKNCTLSIVSILVLFAFYARHNVNHTYGRDLIVNSAKLVLENEFEKLDQKEKFNPLVMKKLRKELDGYQLLLKNTQSDCFNFSDNCLIALSIDDYEGRKDIEVIYIVERSLKIVRICSMVMPNFYSWFVSFFGVYPDDCKFKISN